MQRVGLVRRIIEDLRRVERFDDDRDAVFEPCTVGEARDVMVERSPFGRIAFLDQIDRIGDRLVAALHLAGDKQAFRRHRIVADLLFGGFVAGH